MPRLRPSRPTVVVALAMVAAVVGRAPSIQWPLRPDEAGFLLVAQTWNPQPDSLFGLYWVDRPPSLIALFRFSDWLGGPYFIRVLAALGAALFVLAAAATARRLGVYGAARNPSQIALWVAVASAALLSHAAIDNVSAKGEILGLPLVMWSCWSAIKALQQRSAWLAALAGALALLAMGLKQNLVGGLVFGGVLLLAAVLTSRLERRDFLRLAGAAGAGAAVPVLATVGWCLAAGVQLSTLSYATVGFRADASSVLSAQSSDAVDVRIGIVLAAALVSGLVPLVLWFLFRLPRLLRATPTTALAVAVMLVVDVAGVFLSGSYWRTYLVVPIAPAVLGLGLLLADEQSRPSRPWRPSALATRGLVILLAVSSVVALVEWERTLGRRPPTEFLTGLALAEASAPDDTLIVYGGRADIQWASGMPSPYAHLWSLPMRTLDPQLEQLQGVLAGPEAPAWFVAFTRLDAWSEAGTDGIREELLTDYELVSIVCGSYRVYLRRDLERPDLRVDCGGRFDPVLPISR